MKNILVIGAGRSSLGLISYLLAEAQMHGWLITVADAQPKLAEEKIAGHPNGLAVWLDVQKPNDRKDLIRRVDVVVSLLPPHLHLLVAKDCLQLNKHLLTASYVTTEMYDLDDLFKEKRLIFIGEMGLDPGIDHMSVMQKINEIKSAGGVLTALRSYTGGLVAPESDDNPWHYKITWNPRNVVTAGKGTTQYLQDGKYKYVPYHQLFRNPVPVQIEGLGTLEMYPNRDSLTYRSHYGIESIPNLVRGTLRYPGFCAAWSKLVELGLTEDTIPIIGSEFMRYRDLIDAFTYGSQGSLQDRVAKQLGIEPEGEIMQLLAWLGLFSQRQIDLADATPADILETLIIDRWALHKGDHDMVVMQHEFVYQTDQSEKTHISTMITRGDGRGLTAMTKLVGWPLAIATKLIMQQKITTPGVRIPTHADIYEPVLEELVSSKVAFTESERE